MKKFIQLTSIKNKKEELFYINISNIDIFYIEKNKTILKRIHGNAIIVKETPEEIIKKIQSEKSLEDKPINWV